MEDEKVEFIGWLDDLDLRAIIGARIIAVYDNMGDLHIILDNGESICWKNYRGYPEDWMIGICDAQVVKESIEETIKDLEEKLEKINSAHKKASEIIGTISYLKNILSLMNSNEDEKHKER